MQALSHVRVNRLFEALQVHNATTVDKSCKVKCLLLDIDERLVGLHNVVYYSIISTGIYGGLRMYF